MMTYNCKCEKCGQVTEVHVKEGDPVFITCYGYLNVKCGDKRCRGNAYAPWFGYDGDYMPRTNL